jgi:hypothetical protein
VRSSELQYHVVRTEPDVSEEYRLHILNLPPASTGSSLGLPFDTEDGGNMFLSPVALRMTRSNKTQDSTLHSYRSESLEFKLYISQETVVNVKRKLGSVIPDVPSFEVNV